MGVLGGSKCRDVRRWLGKCGGIRRWLGKCGGIRRCGKCGVLGGVASVGC